METAILMQYSDPIDLVSEELNSVETSEVTGKLPKDRAFQKNLIVWKLLILYTYTSVM